VENAIASITRRYDMMFRAASEGDLEMAEGLALSLPQVDLAVVHHFGPGFCIREMSIPAGHYVVGHAHKQPLANMLVKGEMLVCSEGRWSRLTAPFFFVGTPGRKMGIALSHSIWQNILVTDETDPAKIEQLFTSHSEAWEAHHNPQGERA
jgi:hypothetical protein